MISQRPALPSRPAPRSPLAHQHQKRNASVSAPPAPQQLNVLTISTVQSPASPTNNTEPRSPLSPPARPPPGRPSSSSLSTQSPSSLSSNRQSTTTTSPRSGPSPSLLSSAAATPSTSVPLTATAEVSSRHTLSKVSENKRHVLHKRVFNPHVHTVPFSAFPDLSPNSPPATASDATPGSPLMHSTSTHRLPYPIPVLCTSRPVTADWLIHHNTTLGAGFSSTVKLATSLHNDTLQAACKIIDKRQSNMDLVKFADECSVLSGVGWHGNIVEMYGSYESDTHVHVLTEVCRGGELFDVLCERGDGGMDEWEAAPLIAQLLEALAYLHSRGICHRDVKPENCLFLQPYTYTQPSTSPASTQTTINTATASSSNARPPTSSTIPTLKLSDFGFAANLLTKPRALRASSHLGSLGYTAPEIFGASSYTESCDVWSVGAILHIMMTGRPPYTPALEEGDRSQPFWVYVNEMRWGERQGEVVVGGRGWEGRSEEVQLLVRGMLEVDVAKRLRASEALQSGWVKEGRERWKRANAVATDQSAAAGDASGWSSLSVRERTTSKASTQLTMREVMAEIVLRAGQTKEGGVEGAKEEEECKQATAAADAADGASDGTARLEKRPVAQRRLKALTMLDWGRG